MPEATTYQFRFVCGYMGCTSYAVQGDGPAYEVEVRRVATSYERSIINGGDEAFRHEMAKIGLMQRRSHVELGVCDAVVAAFNAWRLAEHDRLMAQMDGDSYRYGIIAPDDPLRIPPAIAYGGRYEVGKGWLVNGALEHDTYPCDGCSRFTHETELAGLTTTVPGRSPTDIDRRVCTECLVAQSAQMLQLQAPVAISQDAG